MQLQPSQMYSKLVNILPLFIVLPFIPSFMAFCEHTLQTNNSETMIPYCVYHNIEDVLRVLVPALKHQPPLPEVMQVYHKDPTVMQAVLPMYNRKPFIVLEGIQGTKKTAIAKRLALAINGTYIQSPPLVMNRLSSYLHDRCSTVNSAFMAFGNYIVAEQARKLLATGPVVVDKYWHWVTAYNLAKAAKDYGIELPPSTSIVYFWPEDLLMPDMVFYIVVAEEVLKSRVAPGLSSVYPKNFRNDIHTVFLRMSHPKMLKINGNLKLVQVESQISMKIFKRFSKTLFPFKENKCMMA